MAEESSVLYTPFNFIHVFSTQILEFLKDFPSVLDTTEFGSANKEQMQFLQDKSKI